MAGVTPRARWMPSGSQAMRFVPHRILPCWSELLGALLRDFEPNLRAIWHPFYFFSDVAGDGHKFP